MFKLPKLEASWASRRLMVNCESWANDHGKEPRNGWLDKFIQTYLDKERLEDYPHVLDGSSWYVHRYPILTGTDHEEGKRTSIMWWFQFSILRVVSERDQMVPKATERSGSTNYLYTGSAIGHQQAWPRPLPQCMKYNRSQAESD